MQAVHTIDAGLTLVVTNEDLTDPDTVDLLISEASRTFRRLFTEAIEEAEETAAQIEAINEFEDAVREALSLYGGA